MSHHGAQYYLYARWVEQPLSRCWSEPDVTNHCCNPDSSEKFFIRSAFSVFNIKFIRSVFWISKKECILTVKCCDLVFFLYIRHEFDTAIVAIFIKIFSRKFSISFCKKTKKELQQHDFFAFILLLFFQCCGIFNFGYCQFCCVTLSSRAFFDICKWSKNACPTFLKKICILKVWM